MKKVIILSLVSFAGILFLACCVSIEKKVPLYHGGFISVKPGSMLGLWRSGTCRIRYYSSRGVQGTVLLSHDWNSSPVLVLPTEDDKSLFCLCGLEDVGVYLVKIDTTKPFDGISVGFNTHMSEIIRNSPWKVEDGTVEDWKAVYSMVSRMSKREYDQAVIPRYDLGIKRDCAAQEWISLLVKDHIESQVIIR